MGNCIKCNKETDIRLTNDLDIQGIAVCKEHLEEVRQDIVLLLLDVLSEEDFNKKYGLDGKS
jgi:hypothetical protein